MSTTTSEIECLHRLNGLNGSISEILLFLVDEKLILKAKAKEIELSSMPAKELHVFLRDLRSQNAIQLLEYNWTILPKEVIEVAIITDRSQREFSYSAF